MKTNWQNNCLPNANQTGKVIILLQQNCLNTISCMAKCLQQRCLRQNCLEPQLTSPLYVPLNTILFDNLLTRGACRVPSSLTALFSSLSFSTFLIPFLLHNGHPDILAFMFMTNLISTTSSSSKTGPILYYHFPHYVDGLISFASKISLAM